MSNLFKVNQRPNQRHMKTLQVVRNFVVFFYANESDKEIKIIKGKASSDLGLHFRLV